MPGRRKYLKQCQSMTRKSNFTERCNCKGFPTKKGTYRCKYHAGMSTGPTSLEGKIKSLSKLKQYKNKTREEIIHVIENRFNFRAS